MARNLFLAAWFRMHVAGGVASDVPSLRPSDICLGTVVCVANGISRAELGHRFGLPNNRRPTVDDAFTFDCFRLGDRYILATYSSQGRPSAQPEQLDIGLTPQPECKAPTVAKRHADAPLLPVGIGTSEKAVVEKFGKPTRVWTAANSAQGLGQDEEGLVYGAPEENEFVLIVVKGEAVTRIGGSLAP